MWQADTPEHANKLTRIEIGAHRMIPSGIKFQQVNTGAGVQSQLAVSQHFSQLEEQGTGVYRTGATTAQNQARTATEVQAAVGETSKLNNASVGHYLMQGDGLVTEVFRRSTRKTILEADGGGKEALAFKDRCIERGIPEEIFYDLCASARVTMTRPIGNGSYADRIARINAIGQNIGDMPERKRARFIRDRIAYVGGSRELADLYGPDLEQQFPGIEQSLAILENNGFQGGGTQDPFSPDNAHTVHLPIHMEFAAKLVQGNPQQSSPILEPLYAHMAQHVMALENDPTRKAEFKHYEAQIGALQNAMKQVAHMAELQAQAAPQPPQQTPEVIKAQGDVQIQAQSAQADSQIKADKAKNQMAIKDASEAQKIKHREQLQQQQLAERQQQMALDKEEAARKAAMTKTEA